MKYHKTKYPNIFWYETTKGKRYYVRRSFQFQGEKKEVTKSSLLTISQARAVLMEFERKINEQELGVNTNITLDQYWEEFMDRRLRSGRWSDQSYYTYARIYSSQIQPTFGKRKLKDLSRNEYEVFIADKLTVYTRNTVHTLNSTFMAVLNDAVKNGNITANRLKGVYIGQSLIPPHNKKIDLNQFKCFMKAAKENLTKRQYALIYLTIFGLRRGEVFGIRFMDIDFNDDGRAILHLRDSRSIQSLEGKHGLKTARSVRYVSLDTKGTSLIQYLMDEAKRINRAHSVIKDRKNDYISIDDRGKLIHPGQMNAWFKAVSEDVGFHVTPHMMRHFFTTQGIIAGVPMEHLSQALGHTKAFMTDKYNQIEDEIAQSVTDTFMSHIQ